jgi:hypothetical protein
VALPKMVEFSVLHPTRHRSDKDVAMTISPKRSDDIL